MTWIVTLSGTDFDFEKPDPATIDLIDIANVLGRVARYAGHTRG